MYETPEQAQQTKTILEALGYSRAAQVTRGGVLIEEVFFNADAVKVSLEYKYMEDN